MLRFLRKSAPIDIFESISTDDHRALARVSDIVEGKLSYQRSQITGSPTMTVACTDGGKSLMEVVRNGEFSVLQQKEPASMVTIYGKLRIPLMADSDSIPIADSIPCDGGHAARVS